MTVPTHYTTRVAVPMPNDDEIRRVLGPSYDPGTALNVVKMFAGTGDLAPALAALVKAIFSAQGIDPRTREMIILRTAKVLNSPYEWQANVKMAANTGVRPEEIAAAASDGPVTGVGAEYVLVCRATDELTNTGTLDDDTVTALLAHFGDDTTRKVIAMIGWFNMLTMFLNGCRVPLETTDKVGSKTSPLG